MNKEQFLKELEDLLQDIDATEREEALNYYRDYFEDAGSEHEQEIIKELESPKKVAQTIKEGILRGIIVVLLVLLVLPTVGGIGGLIVGAIGLFIGIVCVGVFGTFGLLCAVVALAVVALRLFIDGLIAGGLICLGIGLLLVSLSYLTSLMTVSLFKYLPQAFRAMIDLGKNIYNKVVG